MKVKYLSELDIIQSEADVETLAMIELAEESEDVKRMVAYGLASFDDLAQDAKEREWKTGIAGFAETEIRASMDDEDGCLHGLAGNVEEVARYCESIIKRSNEYRDMMEG